MKPDQSAPQKEAEDAGEAGETGTEIDKSKRRMTMPCGGAPQFKMEQSFLNQPRKGSRINPNPPANNVQPVNNGQPSNPFKIPLKPTNSHHKTPPTSPPASPTTPNTAGNTSPPTNNSNNSNNSKSNPPTPNSARKDTSPPPGRPSTSPAIPNATGTANTGPNTVPLTGPSPGTNRNPSTSQTSNGNGPASGSASTPTAGSTISTGSTLTTGSTPLSSNGNNPIPDSDTFDCNAIDFEVVTPSLMKKIDLNCFHDRLTSENILRFKKNSQFIECLNELTEEVLSGMNQNLAEVIFDADVPIKGFKKFDKMGDNLKKYVDANLGKFDAADLKDNRDLFADWNSNYRRLLILINDKGCETWCEAVFLSEITSADCSFISHQCLLDHLSARGNLNEFLTNPKRIECLNAMKDDVFQNFDENISKLFSSLVVKGFKKYDKLNEEGRKFVENNLAQFDENDFLDNLFSTWPATFVKIHERLQRLQESEKLSFCTSLDFASINSSDCKKVDKRCIEINSAGSNTFIKLSDNSNQEECANNFSDDVFTKGNSEIIFNEKFDASKFTRLELIIGDLVEIFKKILVKCSQIFPSAHANFLLAHGTSDEIKTRLCHVLNQDNISNFSDRCNEITNFNEFSPSLFLNMKPECIQKCQDQAFQDFRGISHLSDKLFSALNRKKLLLVSPEEYANIKSEQIKGLRQPATEDLDHACLALRENQSRLTPDALKSFNEKCVVLIKEDGNNGNMVTSFRFLSLITVAALSQFII